MTYEKIQQELSLLIEGDISILDSDLESHAIDWSLFKIKPQMVVFPKSSQDIEKLVTFVNDHNSKNTEKISLTARAAGTDMTGGPLNTSIIVDVTRYMNKVSPAIVEDFGSQEHREGFPYQISGKITVEPGTKYLAFEEETLKNNLIMPTFPASRKICAVGGMVANNGAGEKTFKYGQNKDFVESLKIILSDGKEYTISKLSYAELNELWSENNLLSTISKEIYALAKENWDFIKSKKPKTSKNSAGYLLWDIISVDTFQEFESGKGFFDLTKLFVGAQGTTGIISEITYKLVKHNEKHEMIVIFANSLQDLPKVVLELQKYDIETIEVYDDNTFKLGVKFFKDFLKDKGLFKAITYTLRFIPEFFMALTGGIPKFIVLAEFTGNDLVELHRETSQALEKIKKNLSDCRVFLVNEKQSEKYWDFRHDSFKLLTEHSKNSRNSGTGTRTVPMIDDIIVRPEYLAEFIPAIISILDKYKDNFVYTIAGHLGDGNFHIIPLADMNVPENREKIVEIADQVYQLTLKFEGSLTAEHNDGIMRTPYLPEMYGEKMIEIFKQIKDIFDPNRIFNPGKKIGFTKSDITKYLA